MNTFCSMLLRYVRLAFFLCVVVSSTPLRLSAQTFKSTGIAFAANLRAGDSIHYRLSANGDTVGAQFFRNKRLLGQQWAKDSLYRYDSKNATYAKYCRLHEDFGNIFEASAFICPSDSMLLYHANGRIAQLTVCTRSAGGYFQYLFDDDGSTIFRIQGIKSADTAVFPTAYEVKTDYEGKKVHSRHKTTQRIGADTLAVRTDTLFYANGRPSNIKKWHSKTTYDTDVQYEQFYNEQGTLLETVPADSLKWQTYKDNIGCLYGFRNQRGDTVLSAKYETEHVIDNNRWVVQVGDTALLMRTDGQWIATPFANSIALLDQTSLPDLRASQNAYAYQAQRILGIDDSERGRFLIASERVNSLSPYFSYTVDKQMGIIDRNGKVVMPPQPFTDLTAIHQNTLLRATADPMLTLPNAIQYLNFKTYYPVQDKDSYAKIRQVGYLYPNGRRVLDEGIKRAAFTYYRDYFIVSPDENPLEGNAPLTVGLAQPQKPMILPPVFSNISPILLTPLFIVQKVYSAGAGITEQKMGLFNVETRQWLLDTATCSSIQPFNMYRETRIVDGVKLRDIAPTQYFIFQNSETKKYGLIDVRGKIILPCENTFITRNVESTVIIYYNETQYNIFCPTRPSFKYRGDYSAMYQSVITNLPTGIVETYYIAQNRAGKWGCIRSSDEQIVLPFEYEYAGQLANSFAFVKEGRAKFILDDFTPTDTLTEAVAERTTDTYFDYLDKREHRFFAVSKDGRVTLAPEYLQTQVTEKYIVIEDKKGRNKLFIKADKSIIADTKANRIRYAAGDSPLVVENEWSDTLRQEQLEQMELQWQKNTRIYSRKTGEPLLDTAQFAVAIGSEAQTVFFAKPDTPSVAKLDRPASINGDTLLFIDGNWLMYDSTGHQLNATPFRFPITFRNHLGVGMQGDKMGIFSTNGSAVLPANAQKIWRDEATGWYYLYTVTGLSPSISVLDTNAKVRVNVAPYNAIAPFRGKYTLVQQQENIGLIDTTGKEIIAPTDLLNYERNLMDSFALGLHRPQEDSTKPSFNEVKLAINKFFYGAYSYSEGLDSLPDTLYVPTVLRHTVGNALLYTTLNYFMTNRSTPQLNRVSSDNITGDMSPWYMTTDDSERFYTDTDTTYENRPKYSDIEARAQFISFQMEDYPLNGVPNFNNFIHCRGHWERLSNSSFFLSASDKQTALFQLLVKKIKALEDPIDCSNSASILTQAQSQFLIRPSGVKVFLKQEDKGFTSITLTWAELKGLTMTWE